MTITTLIRLWVVSVVLGASPAADPDTQTENPEPAIIPALQTWNGGRGWLHLDAGELVVDARSADRLDATVAVMCEDLATLGLGAFTVVKANAPKVGKIFVSLEGAPAQAGREGYDLDIADAVVIRASSPAGVFNGTRSVLQLLAQERERLLLPRGHTVDHPDYQQRMVMIDVARKPFPISVLKDYLRCMSWYKMNELHLHLSDDSAAYSAFRVESKRFPGLAAKDLFYSQQELRELQDFAKVRNITLTPEIDMPGHAGSLTRYWPELRHPKLNMNYLDVTNPNTVVRMKELLDELIPLFDAPDFHIGTDEFGLGGLSEPERKEMGEAFRRFINVMNDHVRSKGKNCRIWSGFEDMPGTTLPDPTVIVDMWVTDDAKVLIDRGNRVINSNQSYTYIVPGAHYYGINNAGIYNNWEPWRIGGDPARSPAKGDPHLLGGKLHIWNDQGPSGYTLTEIADLSFPGIQAFAEKLWGRKGAKNYRDFLTQRVVRIGPAPGTTILERIPAKDPSGRILAVPGEQVLSTASTTIPLLFAKAERADLEYPWTLTMRVKKTGTAQTRGVILSSDLVEVCADQVEERTVEAQDDAGKKTKRKVIKTGFGLIRAAGNPDKDPMGSSYWRDVSHVYADPLPVDTWVKVTVVGTRRQTRVYLNGVLTGSSTDQMVCPLARIGSATGNSFVGTIADLEVWNRAFSAAEIGRAAGLTIPDNLAEGHPVTATRTDGEFWPEYITDGDAATRWSSGGGAADWVTINLGSVQSIDHVAIDWEHAYAKRYAILISTDGQMWTEVFNGPGLDGRSLATFAANRTRFVRISGLQTATPYGYSIWEVGVFGPGQ